MKVACYVRCSTVDKQNPETQRNHLTNYSKNNDLSIYKFYEDVGQSGAKSSRPSFDEMLKDMREGLFEGVLVYRLDRIGRSLPHLVKLFEEFKKKKVAFISATQNINTATPEGRMFLGVLMVLAQYERELTVDRIKSGLARARKQGKKLGRKFGSKDTKRRRRSGYWQRWKREKNKGGLK
jgi:site-specific DNA recombinase